MVVKNKEPEIGTSMESIIPKRAPAVIPDLTPKRTSQTTIATGNLGEATGTVELRIPAMRRRELGSTGLQFDTSVLAAMVFGGTNYEPAHSTNVGISGTIATSIYSENEEVARLSTGIIGRSLLITNADFVQRPTYEMTQYFGVLGRLPIVDIRTARLYLFGGGDLASTFGKIYDETILNGHAGAQVVVDNPYYACQLSLSAFGGYRKTISSSKVNDTRELGDATGGGLQIGLEKLHHTNFGVKIEGTRYEQVADNRTDLQVGMKITYDL